MARFKGWGRKGNGGVAFLRGFAAAPVQENRLTGGSMALFGITPRRQCLCVCSAAHCQHNMCRCDVFLSAHDDAPIDPHPSPPSTSNHPTCPSQFFFSLPKTNRSVLKHDYDIEYIIEYKKGPRIRSEVRANAPFLSILLLLIMICNQ